MATMEPPIPQITDSESLDVAGRVLKRLSAFNDTHLTVTEHCNLYVKYMCCTLNQCYTDLVHLYSIKRSRFVLHLCLFAIGTVF